MFIKFQNFQSYLGSFSSCCNRITIESNGPADVLQHDKLGNYKYQNKFNDRQSYKLERKDVYLHFSSDNYWQVTTKFVGNTVDRIKVYFRLV